MRSRMGLLGYPCASAAEIAPTHKPMTHAALNIPPPRLQTELRIERRRDTTSGCPSVARVRNGIPAVADRSARRLLRDHRYIRRRVPQDHIGDTIHAMAVALSTAASKRSRRPQVRSGTAYNAKLRAN